jgi:predicted transcriptional regulator
MKKITLQVEIPVGTFEKAERALYRAVIRLNKIKGKGLIEDLRMEEHAGRYYFVVPIPDDEENVVRKIVEEAIREVV